MTEPIIDTNVYLSRWPFRRLAGDQTGDVLGELLGKRGVVQAWASSFDALLHKDIGAVNARTAEECRGVLKPVGAVNPMLPDWREDLRRCHEVHRMRAIRLHPNYNGYKLSDSVFRELLAEAEKRHLLVQIALTMEDDRTQHPLIRVEPVDPAPLRALELRSVQLLNARSYDTALKGVRFDIAMLEGALGLTKLIGEAGVGRVLFGSCAPLFYFESSLLKLKEAGLDDAARAAVLKTNAERLFAR